MDSVTQSSQISSSHGLADGQNAAAKDSKLSGMKMLNTPLNTHYLDSTYNEAICTNDRFVFRVFYRLIRCLM